MGEMREGNGNEKGCSGENGFWGNFLEYRLKRPGWVMARFWVKKVI